LKVERRRGHRQYQARREMKKERKSEETTHAIAEAEKNSSTAMDNKN